MTNPILKYQSKVIRTSSHYHTEVWCMYAYSENHEGNSMLHVTCNFLETNFLNKLILHSFQFIICANIPYIRYLTISRKKTFVSQTKASKIFLLNSDCCRHYKKINLQFFVFTSHSFSCELTILRQKSFKNNRNKASS